MIEVESLIFSPSALEAYRLNGVNLEKMNMTSLHITAPWPVADARADTLEAYRVKGVNLTDALLLFTWRSTCS